MSSLSLLRTCHLLKLSIIFAFQKRKKQCRDEKGHTDLNLNVSEKGQTVPAESPLPSTSQVTKANGRVSHLMGPGLRVPHWVAG